jgi:excinuclease UvrABC ATPase subunit
MFKKLRKILKSGSEESSEESDENKSFFDFVVCAMCGQSSVPLYEKTRFSDKPQGGICSSCGGTGKVIVFKKRTNNKLE